MWYCSFSPASLTCVSSLSLLLILSELDLHPSLPLLLPFVHAVPTTTRRQLRPTDHQRRSSRRVYDKEVRELITHYLSVITFTPLYRGQLYISSHVRYHFK
ncbi:hypothetical protein M501DRAFT_196297 [Patellaria atrata CBS 101060]|uniref:Secreted protein n=1 Tax=Patellaria atrata CBS 101060 TaxID=1346257 RepID=A0A9P4S6W4_9PEZI|nr:hypothetical protein M501DRAFT_196297 [Patellaria atrata CBS 101060]